MRKSGWPVRALYFMYAALILLFVHHYVMRPIFLDWGSPESIQMMSLPGDRFTEGPKHTRAILINTTPDSLWPWLVQVGQDRGGFYSYQTLENLFLADMKNVYELKNDFQNPRRPGDTIWLASKKRYGGKGYQIAAEVIPYWSLVMVDGNDYAKIKRGEKASGSWAFYLHPEGSTKTWLIARSSEGKRPFFRRLLSYFTFEVPHFIMERKMLISIKDLSEKE